MTDVLQRTMWIKTQLWDLVSEALNEFLNTYTTPMVSYYYSKNKHAK